MKNLFQRLFSKNVDIGPVQVQIGLKEHASREMIEKLFMERGIKIINYIDSIHLYFCTMSKSVYEEMFNTQLLVRPCKNVYGEHSYTYVAYTQPNIPSYLENMIEAVELDDDLYGNPESVSVIRKIMHFSFLDYFRRR